MIVVIADDLSGAAELAEVARRHGLASEVHTRFVPGVDAQVVCIDTGSRAWAPGDAARVTATVAREVVAAGAEWLYFKVDSALRGNVLVAVRAAMEATGGARALLVPANPSRGRVIRAGRYLIDGLPLHESAVAADPEHPRRSAEVAELLGGDPADVAVPDVEGDVDLARLSAGAGAGTVVAGAADFFAALLARRLPDNPARRQPHDQAPVNRSPGPRGVSLVVCGSRASWDIRRREAEAQRVAVFDLATEPASVTQALEEAGIALVGIGHATAADGSTPAMLVSMLADRVAAIADRVHLDRLLLEGGATAAAVVARSGWTRLVAVPGGGSGTAALRPAGADRPTLFIKPGSYPWPRDLWTPGDR